MPKNIIKQNYKVKKQDREEKNGHEGKLIWFSGLSGSGKSTLANLLEFELHKKGFTTYVLDGDNLRLGLNKDLMFTEEDRKENLRRVSEVAKLFVDAGIVVIAAFITPFEEDRNKIRETVGIDNFMHIFVDCPIEVCEQRDVKGLYAKARSGEIKNFTGINSPFEEPRENDLIINSESENLKNSLDKLVFLVLDKVKSNFQ